MIPAAGSPGRVPSMNFMIDLVAGGNRDYPGHGRIL